MSNQIILTRQKILTMISKPMRVKGGEFYLSEIIKPLTGYIKNLI